MKRLYHGCLWAAYGASLAVIAAVSVAAITGLWR